LLSFLYNYFDAYFYIIIDPTKLFSDLGLAKFLNMSAKSLFSCNVSYVINVMIAQARQTRLLLFRSRKEMLLAVCTCTSRVIKASWK